MQLLGLLHRTRSCIVSNFWLAGMPSRHYLAATGCPSLAPVLVLLGGQNSISAAPAPGGGGLVWGGKGAGGGGGRGGGGGGELIHRLSFTRHF